MLLLSFLSDSPNIVKQNIESYPWELLIRQAKHATLLSRVADKLRTLNILDNIPEQPRTHFQNALKLSDANARSAKWEIVDTYKLLHAEKIDFIILKGTAYIWTNNKAASGRLFADTDILIKKNELNQAERKLVFNGWVTTKIESYDQNFYREWMYEIPPLHHLVRHTSLDVHHSILPPIIKSRFNIDHFWEDAVEDPKYPGLYTLSLTDMILHSATHLFQEGEFDNGLRDISDLHEMINEFKQQGNSWETLLARARKLDLSTYLYYALKYCSKILHTAIPDEIIQQVSHDANFGIFHNSLMEKLFLRALLPNHSTHPIPGSDLARWILFIRSHWIKMPFTMLIPHLLRKGFKKDKK